MIPNEIINKFTQQGYTLPEIENAWNEANSNSSYDSFKNEVSNKNTNNSNLATISRKRDSDVLSLQLEVDDILERIQHILKNDVIEFDDSGNKQWKPNPIETEIPFNNYGIHILMSRMTTYINRNVLLSNLKSEDINAAVLQCGLDLARIIYMQYDLMGLNSDRKVQVFMGLINQITDIVFVTWSRAKNGLERETIGKTTQISQNISNQNEPYATNKPSIFNPKRYFGGRL